MVQIESENSAVDKERMKLFACPYSRVISRLLIQRTNPRQQLYRITLSQGKQKLLSLLVLRPSFVIMESQCNKFHHYISGEFGVFFCFGWGFLGAFVCRVLGMLKVIDRIIEYPELKGTHKNH